MLKEMDLYGFVFSGVSELSTSKSTNHLRPFSFKANRVRKVLTEEGSLYVEVLSLKRVTSDVGRCYPFGIT